MNVEFKLFELGDGGAKALVALIGAYYPDAVRGAASVTYQVGDVSATFTGAAALAEHTHAAAENGYAAPGADTPVTIIDGIPHNSLTGEPIPEPAEAFAETPPLPPEAAFATPLAPAGVNSAPPPVPVAPPATPALAPQVPAGVDLDTSGLPWDARIHAANKGKVSGGLWRKKKGLADGEYEAVAAQLRAVMGAPAAPQAPAAALPPAAPPATPQPLANAEYVAPAPTASPVPPASSPPALAPSPSPQDAALATAMSGAQAFTNLMRKVTPAQTAGTLTVQEFQQAVEATGLAQPRDLMNRPDLIPMVEATIDAIIASNPQ